MSGPSSSRWRSPQLIDDVLRPDTRDDCGNRRSVRASLLLMVQSPYLQPFDDVNKRVSRLAANIPLIKANLSPLTFIDVPGSTYTDAMLGVYELNKIDLMKDVFIWAYGRSAARYAATRQSLGEPDPFRLHHRDAIGKVVGQVVRERIDIERLRARWDYFARLQLLRARNVHPSSHSTGRVCSPRPVRYAKGVVRKLRGL